MGTEVNRTQGLHEDTEQSFALQASPFPLLPLNTTRHSTSCNEYVHEDGNQTLQWEHSPFQIPLTFISKSVWNWVEDLNLNNKNLYSPIRALGSERGFRGEGGEVRGGGGLGRAKKRKGNARKGKSIARKSERTGEERKDPQAKKKNKEKEKGEKEGAGERAAQGSERRSNPHNANTHH